MTNRQPSLLIVVLASVIGSLFTQQVSASHPFHVSSAEVHWNPASGNFEVAVCVWPADLEKAIARQQARPINLDQVEDIDVLLRQYVASCFVVRKIGTRQADSRPDAKQPIRWVGHEMDLRKAWLYFEVCGDQRPSQWRIENRLFFELNEDQINQVRLDVGGEPQSISLGIRESFVETTTTKPVGPIGATGAMRSQLLNSN